MCLEHWIRSTYQARAPYWDAGDLATSHARIRAEHGETMARKPKQEAPATSAPEIDEEAKAAQADAIAIAHEASEFVIETQEDVDFAAECLVEIKGKAKDLESREKAITKPLNDALKATRDLFRPAREALDRAENTLKGAIKAFHVQTEERNRAAMQAASEAYRDGDEETARLALANVATLEGVAGVKASQVWAFEVLDPEAVPRAFLVVDDRKVREYMREVVKAGAVPELPGVRFYQDTRIAASASR